MKKILKFFIYLLLFIFSLLFFFPKELAYNFLEQELAKYDIIISNEKRDEGFFGLVIKDADIYVKGINVANVQSLDLSTYLFFNDAKLKNIKLLDSLQNMAPSPVSKAVISYLIIEFDKVNIKANGSFGKVEGFIDLFNQKAILTLEPTAKMKRSYSSILDNMSFKNGRYVYEYKF